MQHPTYSAHLSTQRQPRCADGPRPAGGPLGHPKLCHSRFHSFVHPAHSQRTSDLELYLLSEFQPLEPMPSLAYCPSVTCPEKP